MKIYIQFTYCDSIELFDIVTAILNLFYHCLNTCLMKSSRVILNGKENIQNISSQFFRTSTLASPFNHEQCFTQVFSSGGVILKFREDG